MSSHSLRRYYYIVGRSCSNQKLHTRLYLKEKNHLYLKFTRSRENNFLRLFQQISFSLALELIRFLASTFEKKLLSLVLSILQGLSVFVTLRYFESLLFLHGLLFCLKDVNIVHNAQAPPKMADVNLKIVHFFHYTSRFQFPRKFKVSHGKYSFH